MLDILNELWKNNTDTDTDYIDVYNTKDLDEYIKTRVENLKLFTSFNYNNLSNEARRLIESNQYIISNWDVSNVTDMSYMFCNAEKFNQPLNNWDVSNVTNMDKMFFGAILFNQPLKNWNIKKVKNLQRMFYNAKTFDQDLDNWKAFDGTVVDFMFNNSGMRKKPKWFK